MSSENATTVVAPRRGAFFLTDINRVVPGDIPLPTFRSMTLLTWSIPPPVPVASSSQEKKTVEDSPVTKGSGVSQMIRSSVAFSKRASHSPAVSFSSSERSPPLSPTERSIHSSFSGLADEQEDRNAKVSEKRKFIQNSFPCCHFGRHTSLKGTPYRVRHFAVSRIHFSIVLIPNESLDNFVKDEASEPLPKLNTTATKSSKPKRKGNAATNPPRAETLEEAGASTRLVRSADDLEESFVVFNWSCNPLFVNETIVPSSGARAVVLCEGDVISILECAFNRQTGVVEKHVDAHGKTIVKHSLFDSICPSDDPSAAKERCRDNSGTSWVDEDNYDPFESPLRKGTSIRHPQPIPVYMVRRRELSPEMTVRARSSVRELFSNSPPEKKPAKKKRRKF